MFKKPKLNRSVRNGAVLAAVLVTSTACQDLFVPNLIDPDRDRALGNPSDVEAFIGAAFDPGLYDVIQGSDGGLSGLIISTLLYASPEQTATLSGPTSSVWYLDMLEPRRPINNAATICSTICEWGPRDYWARISSKASIPYDGLQILNKGMVIRDAEGNDVTDRARAFAKFMQAWAWGYSVVVFDRTHIIPETVDIPGSYDELQEFSVNTLVPYDEAIESVLDALDEAIEIAKANPDVVWFPQQTTDQPIPWFATPGPVTNEQFIQMANTLAARLMVINARSPEERAAVDWQRVLQYTANGIQPGNDFLVQLSTNRTSQVLQRTQNNSTGGQTNARWKYYVIGMADQSGRYQDWISKPPAERNRFDIVTPDRRITGPEPTSNGSYTCYRADNNGFLPERGTYLLSAYQWSRHRMENNISCASNNNLNNSGTQRMLTADENALLRAEALLRTGDLEGAAALINITRTRPQRIGNQTYDGLPPVTAAGVPEVDGQCVPRTDSGACGTLMTALRYERFIELAGIDAIRAYADARGFGMLPDGSFMSLPVPGNILDQYGLPNYTYGGVGNPHTLMYDPVD